MHRMAKLREIAKAMDGTVADASPATPIRDGRGKGKSKDTPLKHEAVKVEAAGASAARSVLETPPTPDSACKVDFSRAATTPVIPTVSSTAVKRADTPTDKVATGRIVKSRASLRTPKKVDYRGFAEGAFVEELDGSDPYSGEAAIAGNQGGAGPAGDSEDSADSDGEFVADASD